MQKINLGLDVLNTEYLSQNLQFQRISWCYANHFSPPIQNAILPSNIEDAQWFPKCFF